MSMIAQEVDEHVLAGWYMATKQQAATLEAQAKPAVAVAALLPQFAIGFPDVTEEEMQAIFGKLPQVDGGADEDGLDELAYQTVRGRYL